MHPAGVFTVRAREAESCLATSETRVLGFEALRFEGLGFKVLGFQGLGFRV